MISSQRKQVPSSWTPEDIVQLASAWNTRRVCNWYFLLNYKGVFKIFLCISSHFTLYFSYVRKGCFVTAKSQWCRAYNMHEASQHPQGEPHYDTEPR